ncbi:hypothetical protein CASFOL_002334 [Castilleja foliolosa]|uniref:Uncharacterized protein n=1 Tax=Castilleja foliolosa TaxID=1961234 RepID=A0ABD3EE92_9LAMI
MSNNSVSSISSSLAAIKVKLAQIQQNLCKSKPPRGEPNRFLLATIHHMLCSITEEVLQQVFSPHGFVENIVTFQNFAGFEALIQYQSIQSAISARNFLQGRDIYDGCCQLDLQFSNLDELQVNFNNERAHDITIPTATVEYKPENCHDAHVDCPDHADDAKNLISIDTTHMKDATLDVSNADEPIPQTRQVKVPDMVVALNQQDQVYDAKMIEFVELEVNDLLTSSEISGDDMSIVSSYNLLALNDLIASPKIKRVENVCKGVVPCAKIFDLASSDFVFNLGELHDWSVKFGNLDFAFILGVSDQSKKRSKRDAIKASLAYFLSYTLRTRWFFKRGRMLWIRGRGPKSGRRAKMRSKESKAAYLAIQFYYLVWLFNCLLFIL